MRKENREGCADNRTGADGGRGEHRAAMFRNESTSRSAPILTVELHEAAPDCACILDDTVVFYRTIKG